jgi:hypothetical protein
MTRWLMLAITEVDLLNIVKDGGTVAFSLAVIWALLTKRLVPGWAYRDLEAREKKWQELAMRGTNLTREALGTLQDVTKDGP